MSGLPILRRALTEHFTCVVEGCGKCAETVIFDAAGRWDGSAVCANEAHTLAALEVLGSVRPWVARLADLEREGFV